MAGNFDFRSLKKLTDPKASKDLNSFLEKMPQNAGHTALIAAGIAWAFAASLGLYTAVQVQKLTELRAELSDLSALRPVVPTVKDVRVSQADLVEFSEILRSTYPNLEIRQDGSSITLNSRSTAAFGVFREAIGHVQNGGIGWRVAVQSMCVGRECDVNKLSAKLNINKVTVEKPK